MAMQMNFSIFIIIIIIYHLLLLVFSSCCSDLLSHSSYDCYTVIVLWLDIQIYDLSKLDS